ncbi:MAG: three-Cys-motif partner protein TcmP [Alphaproteobacteria bacterium]|nr:three-Cys-motif partner protein TcmP [Alphaproteobacteria bacterium]
MRPQIERYRGREQSYIKHIFLNKYLEAAAYKLLQRRRRAPVFNFVDAFAGPWRVSDDYKFSDASFSQAIETLETVRRQLTKPGRSGLQVRYRFCERNPASATELRKFAAARQEFDIQVFQGSFEDNIDEVAAACRGGFTFTFIDPTGWNIQSERVFSFLKSLGGEFLFNFMAEEINRHSGWDGVSESVGRFLADPAWEHEFRNLPEDWSNERKILHLLKTKMKEAGIATYLPEVAILRPRDDRVKMRLLLGTHHIQGVEVFRTVQKNVEAEAVSVRQNIEVERSGQPFLFPSNQLAEIEAKREGVSCPAYLERAAGMMWQIIDGTSGIEFGSLTGLVMESVPVRTTDLNKIAVALRRTGQLRFDLPPRKRTPLPTTRIFPA